MFVAIAGFMLWIALQGLIQGTPPDAVPWWVPGAVAVLLIGTAVSFRTIYIRVDDSTIVFGPNPFGRRTFDRRQVARMKGSRWPLTQGTVVFLRSDGSELCSTNGSLWAR